MKKFYYTIGEVCNLLDLKPHVLRYWEKEFPQLKPRKILGRNRKYSLDDVEIVKKIRHMLYEQKFTIDGARSRLKATLREKPQMELEFRIDKNEMLAGIKRELKEIINLLKKK